MKLALEIKFKLSSFEISRILDTVVSTKYFRKKFLWKCNFVLNELFFDFS